MSSVKETIYECLERSGWSLFGCSEDCNGVNFEIKGETNAGRAVLLPVKYSDDLEKGFCGGVRDLLDKFDALELAASWINDGATDSVSDLVEDAGSIYDALENLIIELEEAGLGEEEIKEL